MGWLTQEFNTKSLQSGIKFWTSKLTTLRRFHLFLTIDLVHNWSKKASLSRVSDLNEIDNRRHGALESDMQMVRHSNVPSTITLVSICLILCQFPHHQRSFRSTTCSIRLRLVFALPQHLEDSLSSWPILKGCFRPVTEYSYSAFDLFLIRISDDRLGLVWRCIHL